MHIQTSSVSFNINRQWYSDAFTVFAKSCADPPPHSLQQNLANASTHRCCTGKCVLTRIHPTKCSTITHCNYVLSIRMLQYTVLKS